MTVDQKRSELAKAAEVLDAEIHGLDTVTLDDLGQCARELALRCDVLVVAGGDGTLSDIINFVDTTRTAIAYLPLGTGNAMSHALQYKGNLVDIAKRIRDGEIHEYDVISCDEKKRGFLASIGIDGTIMRLRDEYLAQGKTGFKTYFRAAFKAYFREYKRPIATMIRVDETTFKVQNLLSLMVVKHPYYGFGMYVVPRARLDDRQLHVLSINSGLFMCLIGVATSFSIGNRLGEYRTGQRVAVRLDRPLVLQIDGNNAWEADAFTFRVLLNAVRFKC